MKVKIRLRRSEKGNEQLIMRATEDKSFFVAFINK